MVEKLKGIGLDVDCMACHFEDEGDEHAGGPRVTWKGEQETETQYSVTKEPIEHGGER